MAKKKDFRHTSGGLEDQYFYGRETEIEMIHNYIDLRQHTALVGQRQFGKTALVLKAIERHPNKPLQAHIDLSRKSSLQEASKILIESFMEENFGVKKFLVYLLTDLTGVLNMIVSSTTLLVKKFKLKDYELELKELQSAINAENNGVDLFAKAMEFIDNVAKSNDKEVVLFIDEFQRLKKMLETKNNWEDELWKIRSAMQDSKATTVIIAGSQPSIVEEMISGQNSPFFSGFKHMRIEPIDKESFMSHFKHVCETYEVTDNERVTGFSFEICGGVPSYLSLFGRNLFDEVKKRKCELDADLYFFALENTVSDLQTSFKLIEEKIDEIPHGIAIYKAVFSDISLTEAVANIAGTSLSNIQNNGLKKLIDRGFIRKVGHGKYQVTDRLFGLYIAEFEKAEQLKVVYENEVQKLLNG